MKEIKKVYNEAIKLLESDNLNWVGMSTIKLSKIFNDDLNNLINKKRYDIQLQVEKANMYIRLEQTSFNYYKCFFIKYNNGYYIIDNGVNNRKYYITLENAFFKALKRDSEVYNNIKNTFKKEVQEISKECEMFIDDYL